MWIYLFFKNYKKWRNKKNNWNKKTNKKNRLSVLLVFGWMKYYHPGKQCMNYPCLYSSYVQFLFLIRNLSVVFDPINVSCSSQNLVSYPCCLIISFIRKGSRKAKDLWWQGIPPSVRGRIWKLAIGNDLQITNGKGMKFKEKCHKAGRIGDGFI